MEKPQLINFIAKVLEESGFKVYKNFKTSQKVVDIYAILPTTIGDFGVVIACKNYDRTFEVGVEVLKEMEELGENLKASKVAIVTSSYFSNQAKNYSLRKNIKLVDRDNLLTLAKKFSENQKSTQSSLDDIQNDDYSESEYIQEEYPEYSYDSEDMEYLSRNRNNNSLIYRNSLYRAVEEDRSSNFFIRLFKRKKYNKQKNTILSSSPATLYNRNARPTPSFNIINFLLGNIIVLIILVVAISYLLSFILGSVLKLGDGISGLVEMVTALILSYGLVFKFSIRDSFIIIKGTIVFFVSLIILILLIIF